MDTASSIYGSTSSNTIDQQRRFYIEEKRSNSNSSLYLQIPIQSPNPGVNSQHIISSSSSNSQGSHSQSGPNAQDINWNTVSNRQLMHERCRSLSRQMPLWEGRDCVGSLSAYSHESLDLVQSATTSTAFHSSLDLGNFGMQLPYFQNTVKSTQPTQQKRGRGRPKKSGQRPATGGSIKERPSKKIEKSVLSYLLQDTSTHVELPASQSRLSPNMEPTHLSGSNPSISLEHSAMAQDWIQITPDCIRIAITQSLYQNLQTRGSMIISNVPVRMNLHTKNGKLSWTLNDSKCLPNTEKKVILKWKKKQRKQRLRLKKEEKSKENQKEGSGGAVVPPADVVIRESMGFENFMESANSNQLPLRLIIHSDMADEDDAFLLPPIPRRWIQCQDS